MTLLRCQSDIAATTEEPEEPVLVQDASGITNAAGGPAIQFQSFNMLYSTNNKSVVIFKFVTV